MESIEKRIQPILVWLETNVRRPLDGSYLDTWLMTPAKLKWCEFTKQY